MGWFNYIYLLGFGLFMVSYYYNHKMIKRQNKFINQLIQYYGNKTKIKDKGQDDL